MRFLKILSMAGTKQILSITIMVLFINSGVYSDKSTVQRIRKHQEWLKRHQQSHVKMPASTNLKKSIQLLNLWRFHDHKSNNSNNSYNNNVYKIRESMSGTMESSTPSINDVFPVDSTTTSLIILQNSTPSVLKMLLNSTRTTTAPPQLLSSSVSPVLFTPRIIPGISFNNHSKIRQEQSTAISATTIKTKPLIIVTTTTIKPLLTNTFETKIQSNEFHSYPRWSIWGEWSPCSRSCGGGITHQERKCLNRNLNTGARYVSYDCVGLYKRYRLCNEQPCPYQNEDFRALQCSFYNNIRFQGHVYTWEPYVKDDAECELNCKPINMKYFATLNNSVVDGTPCLHSAEYYRYKYQGPAVCVDGICKAIHVNGFISGLSANNGAVGCGGLLCHPISGTFNKDPLPENAYVHVSLIPAGASNISIVELRHSENLLVLRQDDQTYAFNGDNVKSDSGSYEAAGTIFDYHRLDGLKGNSEGVTEWLTATGPIAESIELMVYSKSFNPGIKYEYLLPITSDSEENYSDWDNDNLLKSGPEDAAVNSSRRRRPYHWKVMGFGTCSKSCGGGIQLPLIRCLREHPLRYYSQRRCTHLSKPTINENLMRCNTQPCPAFWRLNDWSECQCNQGEGLRQRDISCVQELASGVVIQVVDSACMEEKPLQKKTCDCPKSRRRTHSRYRLHGLRSNVTHSPVKYQRDIKAGIWLMAEWNQYCSVECGTGVEYRTIFCDRSKPNTERCDARSTPDIRRPCDSGKPCDTGEWFTGPWSPCNGNCFNLTRNRPVLCIHNQLIVEDQDCKPEIRPQEIEKCSYEEVEYCGAIWHYSDWSNCTKSCDGGTQRRSVKCLEYDHQNDILKDSNKCRYSLREPIYRACNTQKCEDTRLGQLHNDINNSCVDEFANCQWAVKAKLCSYEYYQNNCCYSCTLNSN